ncbi:MAG TPA: substrate-binding domain-containing protein [Syntrophorhabdales bacterium]|nr:substrate-binding domain-containing protein [Syntrophorhabdales bacterium]
MNIRDGRRPTKSYRVAVLLGDRSNPFWTEMGKEYHLLAQETGMEVELFWAHPEKDREAQLNKLFEILALSFDSVVVNPISNKNLVPGIMKAASEGIPILDVGAKTDQESVKEAGPTYHPVLTVDFFQQGFIGGSYICQRLSDSGGGKVAIIEGRPDSAQSMGRSAGAARAFATTPAVHLVYREHADFDRSKAAVVSRTILEKEPDMKAFFCANDVMALGVADIVQAHTGQPGIIIVGVDLTPESREAIRRGFIAASVAFSPAIVARVVLGAVERTMAGKELEKGFAVASTLVSRENVDSYAG